MLLEGTSYPGLAVTNRISFHFKAQQQQSLVLNVLYSGLHNVRLKRIESTPSNHLKNDLKKVKEHKEETSTSFKFPLSRNTHSPILSMSIQLVYIVLFLLSCLLSPTLAQLFPPLHTVNMALRGLPWLAVMIEFQAERGGWHKGEDEQTLNREKGN